MLAGFFSSLINHHKYISPIEACRSHNLSIIYLFSYEITEAPVFDSSTKINLLEKNKTKWSKIGKLWATGLFENYLTITKVETFHGGVAKNLPPTLLLKKSQNSKSFLYVTKIICFGFLLIAERTQDIIKPFYGEIGFLLHYFTKVQKREERPSTCFNGHVWKYLGHFFLILSLSLTLCLK